MPTGLPPVEVHLQFWVGFWQDYNISDLLDIESPPEMTHRIEPPDSSNTFTASDVTIKMYDTVGRTYFNLLRAVTPWTTAPRLFIVESGICLFYGPLLVNSIRFDEIENSIEFTASSALSALSEADATSRFLRTRTPGYWYIPTDSGDLSGIVVASSAAADIGEQFMVGDPVESYDTSGRSQDLGIIRAVETFAAGQWLLRLDEPLRAAPPVNLNVRVPTSAFWQRNVSVVDAVTRLYDSAGLTAPSGATLNISSSASPVNYPFPTFVASPFVTLGYSGKPLGVVPNVSNQQGPTLGTTIATWDFTNPPGTTGATWQYSSTWGRSVSFQPVSYHHKTPKAYLYSGPRFVINPAIGGRGGTSIRQVFFVYAYDYNPASITTNYRYYLKMDTILYWDDGAGDGDYTSLTWSIWREQTTDGYTWTNPTLLKTTSIAKIRDTEFQHTLYDPPSELIGTQVYNGNGTFGFGIVAPWNSGTYNKLVFTEPYLSGTVAYWRLSELDLGTNNVAALANGDGYRGWLEWLNKPGTNVPYLAVGMLDSLPNYQTSGVGNIPKLFTFTYNTGTGAIALNSAFTVPYDVKLWTARFSNYLDFSGNPYMNALGSSDAFGVTLYQFAAFLGSGAQAISTLSPPSPVSAWCDLARIEKPGQPWYPFVAVFGDQVWWVDTQVSSVLPIVAIDGPAGDILAEICAAQGAVIWSLPDSTNYMMARDLPSAMFPSVVTGTPYSSKNLQTDPNGASPNPGLLRFKTQPIWSKYYKVVTVTSDVDETVTAYFPNATAGPYDGAVFRAHGVIQSSNELTVSNSFIVSYSHALAVARRLFTYFGSGYPAIEAEVEHDGRRWEIGRVFNATVMGVYGAFLILESSRSAFGVTTKLQAIYIGAPA